MQRYLSNRSPYTANIETYFGRLLSSLDNEELSGTKGSMDRTWWCWKFTDFSASRFQEAGYAIAWIVKSKHFKFSKAESSKLILAFEDIIVFWADLQNLDGSFDEAYPFERSLAATAFTTFYLGSSIELLRDDISTATLEKALNTIKKAANWLALNNEHHGILSNHLAAAAAALQVSFDITAETHFSEARDEFLNLIYKYQDKNEGWYMEYGGADPGYQSHGMFYLTDIFKRTNDRRLLKSLVSACDFFIWCIHPDGTSGGEYASRGTKFSFPAAFEFLSNYSEAAKKISNHFRNQIDKKELIGIDEMDSWNFYPMLNNYLFADTWYTKKLKLKTSESVLLCEGIKIFKNAGLLFFNKNEISIAIGGKMGGAIKIWQINGKLIYEDLGYFFSIKDKKFSSHTESEFTLDYRGKNIIFTSTSNFIQSKTIRFNSLKFTLFRILSLSVLRFPFFSRTIKKLLVFVLIRNKKNSRASLKRIVTIKNSEEIYLSDKLLRVPVKPQILKRNVPFHMGSARYSTLKEWFGSERKNVSLNDNGDGCYTRKLRLDKLE